MYRWMGIVCALLLGLLVSSRALADESVAAQIRGHAGTHRILVLGEYHGTREIPLVVAQLADVYSRDGTPLVLALEMPRGENASLQAYLDSNGDADARHALRSRAFWKVSDDQHDGRRSRDMLDLIEAMRALRQQHRDVKVLGYDEDISEHGNQSRDDAQAKALRRLHHEAPSQARLMVLAGNVHAMRRRPADAPAEMQQRPMASQLIDLDLYSVRLEAREGEFWACMQRCQALRLRAQAARPPRVETAEDRMYDLIVWTPKFSVARLID
jgi:hypothetical protein